MSDSPMRLPARPSLEQLRKRARDLLRRARGGEVDALSRIGNLPPHRATLASAQHAIAREHGFASWAALRDHVDALRPPGLSRYENMARALAEACMAGDAGAIRELNWTWGTDFRRERDGEAIRRQLGTWFASAGREPGLALADARELVARAYGFDSWPAFAASQSGRPAVLRAPPLIVAASPPFHVIDRRAAHLSVRGPASAEEWDRIAEAIEEYGIAKLTARGITDAGMKRIAGIGAITDLEIGDSKLLTDEGAAALAGMSQLTALEIGGWSSPLTDRALAPLRHLRALRRFRTAWTPGFSDAGAALLAGCEDLEEVSLLGTATGDGAIRALAGKARLRRLATGRCVGDSGLALLDRIPAFAAWQGGIEKLDLMGTEASPTQLVVDGPFTDSGLAAVSRLDGVFALTLFRHSPAFTPAGIAGLGAMAHLACFGIAGESCDDEAMRAIAALPHLRKLIAQGAVAGDAGFAALGRSATLEYLWGRECPNLTGTGFAALAAMTSFRGLAVGLGNLGDAALAALPRFPALRELMPMGLTDAGFAHVGRCAALEHLWCMYCRESGDEATGRIIGLSLKSYYAGMTGITDRSLAMLGRMDTLERLQFWHCAGVTDAGIAKIAGLPQLREIVLNGLTGVSLRGPSLFGPEVTIRYEG